MHEDRVPDAVNVAPTELAREDLLHVATWERLAQQPPHQATMHEDHVRTKSSIQPALTKSLFAANALQTSKNR